MQSPRKMISAYGLDRLLQEIVLEALSNHGWRTPDGLQNADLHSEEPIEIALVFCTGEQPSVIDVVRHVRAETPTARIVLAGVQATEAEFLHFVEEGISACVAGTQGFADLVDTLQQVRSNRTSCPGRITQLVLNNISRLSRQQITGTEGQLTVREKEILHLISDGLSNKEIAGRLCIAPNTVKNHVHHLLEKLQVRSRHEAAWIRTRFPRSCHLAWTNRKYIRA